MARSAAGRAPSLVGLGSKRHVFAPPLLSVALQPTRPRRRPRPSGQGVQVLPDWLRTASTPSCHSTDLSHPRRQRRGQAPRSTTYYPPPPAARALRALEEAPGPRRSRSARPPYDFLYGGSSLYATSGPRIREWSLHAHFFGHLSPSLLHAPRRQPEGAACWTLGGAGRVTVRDIRAQAELRWVTKCLGTLPPYGTPPTGPFFFELTSTSKPRRPWRCRRLLGQLQEYTQSQLSRIPCPASSVEDHKGYPFALLPN
ncbi:hypothetical protein PR202_gb17056 [Eleusine coracana subsp. coracana]|uniref:Uncharacterized protein n=1 Tax=Eleusine coracana subsp. coracana TaxID=191504 RepID=A0AAV5EZL6_ELECO|nr:hypothetical protein PR202_gb17056 [Eleusine coracana subsp. coracana]